MSPAGVVLASGMSRRFGVENKLLVPVGGVPVVRRVVGAYVVAAIRPVVVVVGHEAESVRAALSGLEVQFVDNPDFERGQSRAMVRGVAALPASVPAAIIGVADQPYLDAGVLRALASDWSRTGAAAVAPRYAGQRGNPILYDRALFPELLRITGDQGGRPVFLRHEHEASFVDFTDARFGRDIDTLEDFESLLSPT